MKQFNVNAHLHEANVMNDMSNFILLRNDLHVAYDMRDLIIFPKKTSTFYMCFSPLEDSIFYLIIYCIQ
jgi:hypothetical protein